MKYFLGGIMRRRLLFTSVALAMFIMVSVVGADVRSYLKGSDPIDKNSPAKVVKGFGGQKIDPRSYRSPGRVRKVEVSASDTDALERARAQGAIEVADYGSFKLLAMRVGNGEGRSGDSEAELSALSSVPSNRPSDPSSVRVRDDFNVLLLRSGIIDTTSDEQAGNFVSLGKASSLVTTQSINAVAGRKVGGAGLRLVQFIGPAKREWLEELRASGVEVIAYVPNNAYLVRGDAYAGVRLQRRKGDDAEPFVQWEAPFSDEFKIHPALVAIMNENPEREVLISIQVARTPADNDLQSNADVKAAKKLARETLGNAYNVLGYTNLRMKIEAGRIRKLAALPNVINIEPWKAPELFDERSSQIIAGALTADGKQASNPGYMQWLLAHGFDSQFNFGIDITDTGLDRGAITADKLHPDFLNPSGASRVLYARDFTGDFDGGDVQGHGTLNASIAGGGNLSTDSSARDSGQYGYGIGVAPFALLGSSKIFQAAGRFDLQEPYTKLLAAAYTDGARISSNSWGATSNEYTIESQEYDSRVRDALPSQPGNQEMVICFAAGNAGGGGTIGSPGTGKNVITVAAGENARGGGLDGCGINDDEADSALDIVFFSSGGQLDDGRMKPDITAPGTHVQGAASQHPDFNGSGVCGENSRSPYFPKNQTLYTWSSGTSHSTPIVAGASALARQFFLNRGEQPSAALIKALLVNTTTYMTGELAGGDLPHPRQGWGLLDLGRAFDDAPKVFVNQTHTFTDSGQEWLMTGEIKDATRPFRVSLAWTDAPGLSAFAPWVNDLDLEVTVNGHSYLGNHFDGDVSEPGGEPNTKDNIESVWLPAGTTGAFQVRVRASVIAGDGVPGNASSNDQDFALVVYNGEKKDTAVTLVEDVNLGSTLLPNHSSDLKVRLKNVSSVPLSGGHATLTTSTPGVNITASESDFPTIAPNGTSENTQSFTVAVNGDVACGTIIELAVNLSAQGVTSRIPLELIVGNVAPATFFADDIESGAAMWTHGSPIKKKKKKTDTWVIATDRFHTGASSWYTPDLPKLSDAYLDTLPIQLPSDGRDLQLVFYHTFGFESFGYDGGVLEISTGDNVFEDLGSHILEGGYNGDILSFSENPLAGRPGWIDGRLGVFQRVVVDLNSYVGKTVTIRWHIGTDTSFKGYGWYVDDVTVAGNRVTCNSAANE